MRSKVYLSIAITFLIFISGLYVLNKPPLPTIENKYNPTITYQCETGKTAFELLQQKHDVKSTDSEFGALVTSINGTEQSRNKYWLYSVDGKEATVSASFYNCQEKESIKWELK